MRLIDSTLHRCVLGLGIGRRWLRERLGELDVRIPLCEGCLQELVHDAEAASWQRLVVSAGGMRYLEVLREEILVRAEFVRRWTRSDERIEPDDGLGTLVTLARKYALPRPWKVTEPVAAESRRRAPSYWRWASGAEAVSAR
ncbi:MAG: hypothetical protein ACREUT_03370 [Steroidobacteraceae bacterium]